MEANKHKILDCTLRDGGLLNNFNFSEEYIKKHLRLLSLAKVDYIEIGYKRDVYEPSSSLEYSQDDYIYSLIDKIEDLSQLSCMIDYGDYDVRKLNTSDKSPFSMIRIACYLKDLVGAVEDAKVLSDKGYLTMINIMAISTENKNDLINGLRIINKECKETGVYIVDSFGSLLPRDISLFTELFKNELGERTLGIHTHNNLQLSFANTLAAMESGVTFLDASVNGLGRGAGNCPIEILVGRLQSEGYQLEPVLSLTEEMIKEFKNEISWGYNLKNLLTGIFNLHPVNTLIGNDRNISELLKRIKP